MYVYKSIYGGTKTSVGDTYYWQYYAKPLMVSNYVAGTLFTFTV
jgi:hypothetical protein